MNPNTHSTENLFQNEKRSAFTPDADINTKAFGDQLQEYLKAVLSVGSSAAIDDQLSPSASFKTQNAPHNDAFVFSAPAIPSTDKATQSKRVHKRKQPFVCKVCAKGFSLRSKLNIHMRSHKGNKPFPCPRCNRGFGNQSNRLIHIVIEACLRAGRNLRKITGGWLCTTCDSGIKGDRDYAERHARRHENDKCLDCHVCLTDFKGQNGDALVKHVQENHPAYLKSCGV